MFITKHCSTVKVKDDHEEPHMDMRYFIIIVIPVVKSATLTHHLL